MLCTLQLSTHVTRVPYLIDLDLSYLFKSCLPFCRFSMSKTHQIHLSMAINWWEQNWPIPYHSHEVFLQNVVPNALLLCFIMKPRSLHWRCFQVDNNYREINVESSDHCLAQKTFPVRRHRIPPGLYLLLHLLQWQLALEYMDCSANAPEMLLMLFLPVDPS